MSEEAGRASFKEWLCPDSRAKRFLYLTVSGILSGICMAFPSVLGAIIEWVAFIPAALAVYSAIEKRVSLSAAYLGGFWLVYSQHVIVYHWFISFYPLDFTGMSKPAAAGVVVVAILGLSFLAAIFGGVWGLVTVLVSRLDTVRRYPVLVPVLASCGYVLNEWIRTKFWFGVPWGRLPLGQLTEGTPIFSLSASWFGSYFVTLLIVLVSFLLAQAMRLGQFRLRGSVALALVVANLACGVIIALIPTSAGETVRVAAIQGNINSRDKWDPNVSSIEIYCDLSREAAMDGAELIVWPETALPYEIAENGSVVVAISSISKEFGCAVIFGCFDYDDSGAPRNILRMIDECGVLSDTVYVKRHLVPFGEYVPMREIIMAVFPPLGEIGMLEEDLAAGDGSELYSITVGENSFLAGGLICFDSIYEELAYSSAADGADLLCVSTNDSWFEDSRAVYMHCAQSRLRAIETGLPIVRAANTGISAIITPKGNVVDDIAPLVRGYIVSDVSVGAPGYNSEAASRALLCLCALYILSLPIASAVAGIKKKK